METHKKVLICIIVFIFFRRLTAHEVTAQIRRTDRLKLEHKTKSDRDFPSFVSSSNRKTSAFRPPNKPLNDSLNRGTQSKHKALSRRFDLESGFDDSKHSSRLDNLWFNKKPNNNTSRRNENTRKIDHSLAWPAFATSKKDIYHRNRKPQKFPDPIESFLALDSKLHELSDRKYTHEHEGFFFPIHLPSSHHHEKEDHILIPLLLLILIPLLLFAIIIPLNANLLSTLFLIMQNNGATTTAAQLAPGRRRKRFIHETHPVIEERIFELLNVIHKIIDLTEDANFN